MIADLPKVTIGIPTYNQEQYIQQAVESALVQDYPNLEIVVLDDGSTDQTKQIIMGYLDDKRLRYFRNEKNLGRVGNYRRLFYTYATGEWYVNLDGDDYYTDNSFITAGMDMILQYQQQGYDVMFYHSALQGLEGDKFMCYIPAIKGEHVLLSGKDYFCRFFSLNASSHLTIITNRLKALKIDYYSTDTLFSDVHSFLRLSLHGYVILDKRVSAVWRIHGDNASHTFKTSEAVFKKEVDSRRDISRYAIPFVGKAVAAKWLRLAYKDLVHSLVYKNVRTDTVSLRDWELLVKYFRFSRFFVKQLLKYIFLTLKTIINKPAS